MRALKGRELVASAVLLILTGIAIATPASSTAAPVFADGFESGNTSNWTVASNLLVQETHVRSGVWAGEAKSTGSPAYAWRDLGSTYTDLHATSRFLLLSQSTGVWLHSLRRSTGPAIALIGINARRKLVLRNAVSGTTSVSSTVVTPGVWHEVEIRVLIGASGRADVWYDGNPVADLGRGGNFGSSPIRRLMIGDNASGKRFDVAIDDVVVATEQLPGDGIPPTTPTDLVATSQGSSQIRLTWTASSDDVGVAGYTVFRSTDGLAFTQVGTSPTASFDDANHASATRYWYSVDAFDAAGNRSLRSNVASATTGPPPFADQMGRWSPPFEIATVGVHAMVLHTGEVLLVHGRNGTNGTVAKLWDPATGIVTDASYAAPHNLLCAGFSFLPTGEVFFTGGTIWGGSGTYGSAQTAIFDPGSRSWRAGPTMAQARWYPTNVSLPDGRVLIFAGKINPTVTADTVERYDPSTNALITLPATATMKMAAYPRMFLRADGSIIRVGVEQLAKYFDPTTETWSDGPATGFGTRSNGSAILLPDDRVLAIGGQNGGVTTPTTEILDLGAGSPTWRYSASMAFPRKNLDPVLLPDGSVLVVGGNRQASYDLPVLAAERFDPATETWTTLASHAAPRAYHSTAVLLPDGRVLVAGQTSGTQQTTAEVFSPPYLFRGPRPVIGAAPSNAGRGTSFSVGTPDAGRVTRVALIRPDSVTHGVNFDQRYLSLRFTSTSDGLSVEAPTPSQAPPGWYMLFLIDGDGIPSVASWIQLT